ncbi:MAG: hypothetical protein K0R55_1279 [Sporomusa sp.]|nr:hypothetical protein [Sporomusa sp.]
MVRPVYWAVELLCLRLAESALVFGQIVAMCCIDNTLLGDTLRIFKTLCYKTLFSEMPLISKIQLNSADCFCYPLIPYIGMVFAMSRIAMIRFHSCK